MTLPMPTIKIKDASFNGLWLVILAVLLNNLTSAQDAGVVTPSPYNIGLNNYIREWTGVRPDTADADFTTGSPASAARLGTRYYDGLGRLVQTVVKQGALITGGNPVDMVNPVVYDSYGRIQRQYLPFAANGTGGNASISDGGYKLNPFQEQSWFYSDANPASPITGQGETFYYGKTEFEPSPLNRPIRVYGAGNNWVSGGGKGLTYNYWVNTPADSVKIWSVTNGSLGSFGAYSVTGGYVAGELYKNVTTDENGKQVITFIDRENKVILKKVQFAAAADAGSGSGYTGWLCTYYVYDTLNNNLRCVIQPATVAQLPGAGWALSPTMLNEGCFRYEYDGRMRMILKQVPGAGVVWMVYDQWDRLVLSQDANLRGQNQWLFTKYDILNRPIITGFYTDNIHTSQSSEQSYLNSLGMGRYETFDNTRYPEYSLTNSFPSVSASAVLTYTYYDDYSWSGWYGPYGSKDNSFDGYFPAASNTTFPYPQPLTQSANTRGLVTGAWDGSGSGLVTAIFYDDYKRVIQTKYFNFTGGVDIATTQYAFTGQPVMTTSSIVKAGTNTQTTLVLTQETYDSLGRVLQVQKKVGNSLVNGGALPAAWTTTLQNSYDALGRLSQKNLGNKPGAPSGTPLTNQLYTYNIRGWLTDINKDYVASGATADRYFGLELGYDKPGSVLTNTPYLRQQYNGNIAGMTWRGAGDQVGRKYDFEYDAVNRFAKAYFNQNTSGSTWEHSTVDFSVYGFDADNNWQLKYDANGNLLTMIQQGYKPGGPGIIDALYYTYYSGSNRLLQVWDDLNDSTSRLGDFHYNNPTKSKGVTIDYSYDPNGNLSSDRNKNISNIVYNYLNLPTIIYVTGKGHISYSYDAGGNKLQKIIVDSSQPTPKTTTFTYLSGAVYQNDTLQLVSHEEGRIRPNLQRNGFVYDYFMKDHLGNTRMVLTEEGQTDAYPVASLEDATIATERLYYGNLDSGRVNKSTVPGYPNDTYTSPNNYIQQLSGSTGAYKIGASITIKVMAGDTVNIRASSWYRQNGTTPGSPNSPLASLVVGLASGLTGSDPGHYIQGQLQQPGVLDPGITSFLSAVNTDYNANTSKPKAYLNWILFDEQFHPVITNDGKNSGFDRVGSDTILKTHIIPGQVMTKSGYLFVYVSDETPNINVYFDNLQLTHMRGRIVEETHYYPFGLTMAGISYQEIGKPENKYRYNGKELQHQEFNDGSGLEWYDYGARMYDNQIGRFTTQDPHSYHYATSTPYNYAFNNPISNIDPDGRDGKVSGTGTEDDPYTITANYYYYRLNEKQAKGFNQAISNYNNGGKAVKVKVDGKTVYVKFNLSAKEVADKDEATKAARGDTYEATDGSTKRFGNIVDADFNGNSGDAYARSNNFEISLNAELVDKHTTEGQDVDGTNVVLDYGKLVSSAFSHEIGHNLTGIHGDPGGLMDKVGTQVQNNQIGGTKIFTNYPTVTKAAIGAMMQRIDKPYGTDYAKDADYIQAVQSGQTVNAKDYGTTGRIYTEKKN